MKWFRGAVTFVGARLGLIAAAALVATTLFAGTAAAKFGVTPETAKKELADHPDALGPDGPFFTEKDAKADADKRAGQGFHTMVEYDDVGNFWYVYRWPVK